MYSSDFYPTLQVLPQTLGSYILKYVDNPYSKILTVGLRIEGAGAHRTFVSFSLRISILGTPGILLRFIRRKVKTVTGSQNGAGIN